MEILPTLVFMLKNRERACNSESGKKKDLGPYTNHVALRGEGGSGKTPRQTTRGEGGLAENHVTFFLPF